MDGSVHLSGVRGGFHEEVALNLRLEAEGRGGKQREPRSEVRRHFLITKRF